MATAARAAQIETLGGQHVPEFIARQLAEIGSVGVWLGRRGEIGIADIRLTLGVLDELVTDITRLRFGIAHLPRPEPDRSCTNGRASSTTGARPPKATQLGSPVAAR